MQVSGTLVGCLPPDVHGSKYAWSLRRRRCSSQLCKALRNSRWRRRYGGVDRTSAPRVEDLEISRGFIKDKREMAGEDCIPRMRAHFTAKVQGKHLLSWIANRVCASSP
jgi:hypothetical protein